MKRIFIILCLITICNISYADIASVGYVDSVVDSLPAVAKTGSYNDLSNKPTIPNIPTTISSFTNDSGYITNAYHDSTKQDKLPTGPSGGRYNLVWNGNTGNFVFELVPHSQCPSGTYDIGFEQCVDSSINADDYTNDRYTMTYRANFSYGMIKGSALCSSTYRSGEFSTGSPDETPNSGPRCWCKMTEPAASNWVHDSGTSCTTVDCCAINCVINCGYRVANEFSFRSAMFGSVGN